MKADTNRISAVREKRIDAAAISLGLWQNFGGVDVF